MVVPRASFVCIDARIGAHCKPSATENSGSAIRAQGFFLQFFAEPVGASKYPVITNQSLRMHLHQLNSRVVTQGDLL